MSVLHAAIFRALAAINARVMRLKPGLVGLTGDEIGFAGKRRHPEGMDYVAANQPELYRHPSGNVNFVGGCKNAGWVVAQIAHLPPPLTASDFDGQGGLR